MRGPSRTGERSAALFLLGLLLFSPLGLAIFSADVALWGLPLSFVYVFAAWATLIVLLTAVAEGADGTADRDRTDDPGEPEPMA